MRKNSVLVKDPVSRAHKRHRVPKEKTSRALLAVSRLTIRAYLHGTLRFRKIELRSPEAVVDAYRDFQQGRTRLIVAFRHPYGDEAQLLFHVFNNLLPRSARVLHRRLRHGTHIRIMHDYARPLWGDLFLRQVLPRIGAVPVYRVKFDSARLKLIRSILLDDRYPLALAPEGQVSYRSETLPRIEQGTVRMGFWCVKDLEKAERPEHVKILPLSVHYRFDPRDQKKLWQILDQLDATCGFAGSPVLARFRKEPSTLEGLQRRIDNLENRVLEVAEAFYAGSFGYVPAPVPLAGSPDAPATVSTVEAAAARRKRWDVLQEVALLTAENALGLSPFNVPEPGDRNAADPNDPIERIYRIRQECWDRIYPVTPADGFSRLETSLQGRRTGEAWYAMRHMEFVDLVYYLDPDYQRGPNGEGPVFDRQVEAVISLADLISRLMGGDFTNRLNVIRKHAVIIPAPLLDLNDYNVPGTKVGYAVCQEATDELRRRFDDSIRAAMDDR
jgi:hypothetical protein